MARRVRYFKNTEFDKELRTLEIKMSAYNSYIYYCDLIKKGAISIDEVEKYLNQKTGFVNPRMSADAMGVLDAYSKAVELENNFTGIDMTALDASINKSGRMIYKIKPSYIDLLKEKHTVYYSAEQSKSIEILEKAVGMLNELDSPFKSALGYNTRDGRWVWHKQHTDNNLRTHKYARN